MSYDITGLCAFLSVGGKAYRLPGQIVESSIFLMPTCERGNVDAVVVFPGRDFFAFTTVFVLVDAIACCLFAVVIWAISAVFVLSES